MKDFSRSLKKKAKVFVQMHDLVVEYMRYTIYEKFKYLSSFEINNKYYNSELDDIHREGYAFVHILNDILEDLKKKDKEGIIEFEFEISNKRKEICKELEKIFNMKLKNDKDHYTKHRYIFKMDINTFEEIWCLAKMKLEK